MPNSKQSISPLFAELPAPRLVPPNEEEAWEFRLYQRDQNSGQVSITQGPLGEQVVGFQAYHPGHRVLVTLGVSPNGLAKVYVTGDSGAVLIPYLVVTPGSRGPVPGVYVGVVEQRRMLIDAGRTMTKEFPRGFQDLGESLASTAIREASEESGVASHLRERLFELPGAPSNPNSWFWQTDQEQETGIRFFGLEFASDELTWDLDATTGSPRGRLLGNLVGPTNHEAHEFINPQGLLFLPVEEAALSPDGFTKSGVGTLLGFLLRQKRLLVG